MDNENAVAVIILAIISIDLADQSKQKSDRQVLRLYHV